MPSGRVQSSHRPATWYSMPWPSVDKDKGLSLGWVLGFLGLLEFVGFCLGFWGLGFRFRGLMIMQAVSRQGV